MQSGEGKAQGNFTMVQNYSIWKWSREFKRWSDSSQSCPVTGQEEIGTNQSTENSV